MSNNVFANGNAIACKAGDDKVIAAMPDVCLSPPTPPAGPVPVPYPNTSFSKDMKDGSTTVKINGQEVMLKDKSFYKTSPLGDEAATNSFGGSVITHTITGKTYFGAWSMDVKFEGENVDRHLDLTTSNHNPYPGSTAPSPAQELAMARMAENPSLCPCCGLDSHVAGENPPPQAMTMREWYEDTASRRPQNTPDQKKAYALHRQKLNRLLSDSTPNGRLRRGCTCASMRPGQRKRELLPSPPCDVFFQKPHDVAAARARTEGIENEYRLNAPAWRESVQIAEGKSAARRTGNHLTPKSAGGCPGSAECDGNLQAKRHLCSVCQDLDKEFSQFQ